MLIMKLDRMRIGFGWIDNYATRFKLLRPNKQQGKEGAAALSTFYLFFFSTSGL